MAFKKPKHLLTLLLPASNSAMTSVYFSQWKTIFQLLGTLNELRMRN